MSNRRTLFKRMAIGLSGLVGLSVVRAAGTETEESPTSTTHGVVMDQDIPLFSSVRTFGDLVFVAGKGAHFQGDIAAHTDHVLKELQRELENAGSSMNNVIKANVYLNDLKDYKAMNDVFRGKFGSNPPVRTTIAAAGGIPGDSLVEIDCIAFIDRKKKKK